MADLGAQFYFTTVAFIAFLGTCVWAFSKRNQASFDQAAKQILSEEEDALHEASVEK